VLVLKRVVATVKVLTSRDLSFRGHSETFWSPHNGNCLLPSELIADFDPFLAEHMLRFGNTDSEIGCYISSTSCEVDATSSVPAVKCMLHLLYQLWSVCYISSTSCEVYATSPLPAVKCMLHLFYQLWKIHSYHGRQNGIILEEIKKTKYFSIILNSALLYRTSIN
jgi:hypothetical protein